MSKFTDKSTLETEVEGDLHMLPRASWGEGEHKIAGLLAIIAAFRQEILLMTSAHQSAQMRGDKLQAQLTDADRTKQDVDEFHRNWSSAAGSLAALRKAHSVALARAAAEFAAGKDETAKALRGLSKDFALLAEAESAEVQRFINKSQEVTGK